MQLACVLDSAQVLQGLDALHRHGIVHLGVKPANILVNDKRMTACIGDFDISMDTRARTESIHHTTRNAPLALSLIPLPALDSIAAPNIKYHTSVCNPFPLKANPHDLVIVRIFSVAHAIVVHCSTRFGGTAGYIAPEVSFLCPEGNLQCCRELPCWHVFLLRACR